MSLDLYNDTILAYAKNPPNKNILENASVMHHEENRTCWDSLDVYLKISENNKVEDFGFMGDTAIITTAAAAMFGESIIGLSLADILSLRENYIKEELWLTVTPRRKKASVLGLLATRNAIHKFLGDWVIDDFSDVLI